jgi:hypothetical protein
MKIPFLFKDKEIPDFYTIELCYIDNKIEKINAVNHKVHPSGIIDIITTDDVLNCIIISSLKSIKFDSNFTKLMNQQPKENK